jgi:hypothetical protein
MSPRVRKQDARYQGVPGYPNLEIDTKSGIYYVRKYIAGRGELFKSTKLRKKQLANTIADQMITEFSTRKKGLKNKRITVAEACGLLLEQLEKDTKTVNKDGHLLRRESTFRNKDLPYLRAPWSGELKELKSREKTRKQGVIRDLFGEEYVDQIDEVYWKDWCKREGRREGIGLNDVAKYLSMVLSYAFEQKYIARKPEIRNPETHKKKAVVYTDEQVLAFFKAAEPELQDLIIIGSENPLRPHENREIPWSMVQILEETYPDTEVRVVEYVLEEHFVKVAKAARRVRLTPNAAAVVARRWKAREGRPEGERSPYVFPAPGDCQRPMGKVYMNRMWHRMKKKAGVPDGVTVHFEWFRHNVFRRLLKIHNVAIANVAQVGGTSMATIQKHYDLEEREAVLQVAGAISLKFEASEQPEAPPAAARRGK